MWRLVLLALALVPGFSAADEVYVRGGGQLTGQIVERGPDSIVIDVGNGRIGLPLAAVERVVSGETPVARYQERGAALAADDAAGWLALGNWARQQGLEVEARAAFETVLSADPGNVAAHRSLGQVQLGGEWMTREESQRARGYVLFEGAWVTPDERRATLEGRRAAAEERAEWAESNARVREAEARTREADARARLAEVDVARAELDLRRAEDETRHPWPGLWGGPWAAGYPGPSYPPFAAPLLAYPGFGPAAFLSPGRPRACAAHPCGRRTVAPLGHSSLSVPGTSLPSLALPHTFVSTTEPRTPTPVSAARSASRRWW